MLSRIQDGDGNGDREGILVKIRLDFKGSHKSGRFLFGGKPTDKAAEETREQQVTVFRNVPLQGISIIDIDVEADVYTVFDDITNNDVAYAPLVLTLKADSLENVIKFITREDFRKIEILDPAFITMNHTDMERLLFKVHEEIKEFSLRMEKKYHS
ncbi:MAG: Uncharacterized protein XD97_0729 [Pelotomaculum thermopropionicum]|uniref:Uncharacterized protein n=1 Tax=Pelotomaculum thermopropionicum TaxID=110500 RepID=A0A101HRI1_9FIRM|nr:MAG: Uncharacterized protein XD97_0729 [Pelotomaculum thermopropionicum]